MIFNWLSRRPVHIHRERTGRPRTHFFSLNCNIYTVPFGKDLVNYTVPFGLFFNNYTVPFSKDLVNYTVPLCQ